MTENLTGRVGRLLSGTVNAMVDAVENMAPEMVMEEAIREVDRAIDDVRAELGRVISSRHMASTRLAEESRKHDELSAKAAVGLSEGREDLAEAAVAKMMDIEAQIPVLESAIAQTGEGEAELERYVAALQARKREMQDELRQFKAAQKSGTAGDDALAGGSGSGGSVEAAVGRAEGAFDRIMERAADLPGGARPASRKSATQLAELDELARQNRIKERLASFKADIGGS